ncbi:MAG: hypothetical protein E7234_06065 [Lachnospiraceae bacterium]|nr:hypothetical protein [Lachnospiraceae bacterium]
MDKMKAIQAADIIKNNFLSGYSLNCYSGNQITIQLKPDEQEALAFAVVTLYEVYITGVIAELYNNFKTEDIDENDRCELYCNDCPHKEVQK